jgi:hypothetical protein
MLWTIATLAAAPAPIAEATFHNTHVIFFSFFFFFLLFFSTPGPIHCAESHCYFTVLGYKGLHLTSPVVIFF